MIIRLLVSENMRDAAVDGQCEVQPAWLYSHWRPDRATVVFIGTVAIGLTLFEFTEEVAARWVNGAYVRIPETPQTGDARRS